jgi:hypothetical protein
MKMKKEIRIIYSIPFEDITVEQLFSLRNVQVECDADEQRVFVVEELGNGKTKW